MDDHNGIVSLRRRHIFQRREHDRLGHSESSLLVQALDAGHKQREFFLELQLHRDQQPQPHRQICSGLQCFGFARSRARGNIDWWRLV